MDLNNVTINISTSRELVPINHDLVNFHAEFKVESEKKEPFRALVVSQTQLDAGDIEMKNVTRGVFAGSLTENLDNAETWYLALEADKEIAVNISLNAAEIESYNAAQAAEKGSKGGMSLWLILLIIAGLIIAGFLVYKYYFASTGTSVRAITPPSTPVRVAVEAASMVELATPIPPPAEPLRIDLSDLPEI